MSREQSAHFTRLTAGFSEPFNYHRNGGWLNPAADDDLPCSTTDGVSQICKICGSNEHSFIFRIPVVDFLNFSLNQAIIEDQFVFFQVDADLSALRDLLPILGGGATGEARVPADWRSNPDFWRPQ